jgi:parallel beta-helix repeat protein
LILLKDGVYKYYIWISIILVILIGLISIKIGGGIEAELNYAIGSTQSLSKTYSTHAPINIISDQNFTDYGFPGLGTYDNPYRIENYNISTTDEKAISIENTNKHFVIQNCFLIAEKNGIFVNNVNTKPITITNNECSNCWDGIFVANGLEVNISNNTCYNNNNYGINVEDFKDKVVIVENNCSRNVFGLRVYSSFGVTVSDNICERNELMGITVWESVSSVCQNICNDNGYSGITSLISYPSLFYNNTCFNNLEYGIHLSGSSSSKVYNNTCFKNRNGLYIIDSFYTQIFNNTYFENEHGITLDRGSWYNSVSENYCYNNTQNGITLAPSWYSTISNNTVRGNHGYGIYSERSIELIFSYNLIQNNENYGIYLADTTNNTLIAYNSFIDNNPFGTSQGYDAGNQNMWFDEEKKIGNYWSDFKGRGKYSIDGSAESVDKYPLDEQLERVTYSRFLIISLILILLSIPIIKRRRKKQQSDY